MSHAVHGLLESGCVDRIVVAGPARHRAVSAPDGTTTDDAPADTSSDTSSDEDTPTAEVPADPRVTVADTADGSLRSAFAEAAPTDEDVVLVHDPRRAFVPASVVRAVVDAVRADGGAAVPVLPVADTVKVVDDAGTIDGTRDRSFLRHVQTPVALRGAVLAQALPASEDDASGGAANPEGAAGDPARLLTHVLAAGTRVRTVDGDPHGMRIRTAFDVAVATALLTTDP